MALPSCRCVGAYPNWKLLGPIVAAARTWAGESPDLHCFDNRPIIDQLRGLYCATLTVSGGGGGGGATLLASFYIPEIVDSFERSIAAGYTGDGDPDPFQREADIDVLRDSHYQSGLTPDGSFVLIQNDPTPCVLVAPENIDVTPGILEFSATWDDIPVTVSLLRYEWRLDDTGLWNDNGVSTTITGEAATAGDHILNVRAISTSGVEGITGDSDTFTVNPSSDALVYSSGVGTPGSYTGNAEFSFYIYYATKFTSPGDYEIHTAELRMDRFGVVPAGTMTAAIYTNNSGHPGVLVGTASTPIDRTTIPTSETWLPFEDMVASISNGVEYWVVLYASSAETGGSIRWYWENGAINKDGSTNGTSWDFTGLVDLGVKLYGS